MGDGGLRVSIVSAKDLEEAAADMGRELMVYVEDAIALPHISTLLEQEPTGRAEVTLVLEIDPSREITLKLKKRIQLSPATAQAIKSLPGVAMAEAL